MMRKLLAVGLVVLLSACTASAPVKNLPADAIVCTSKLDGKLNFTYLPTQATQWRSEAYGVNVYSIDTLEGKRLYLNSPELENYTCVTHTCTNGTCVSK